MPDDHLQEKHLTEISGDPNITRQLQIWLDLSTAREQRRYLENHSHLLDLQYETVVHELLAPISEQSQKAQQERDAIILLQDAHARGGTAEAIREAYINRHGGFVLDLPPWLEEVEKRLIDTSNAKNVEETAETRVVLLQEALEHIEKSALSNPELLATLQLDLADAWFRSQQDRTHALETVIHICEKALYIYTMIHYPYQYAVTQNLLGNAYAERLVGTRQKNLERSIICFQEALPIWTLDAFPFDYAKVQNNLGGSYAERIAGERRENLERAIICFQETLRVQTLDAFPFQYATTQCNLGYTYIDRIAGERQDNLERAITCFQEALHVLTLDTFPFPYAIAQDNLGRAHAMRIAGERRDNLEKSIAYRQEALRVWTLDSFPFYFAMTQHNLGETYLERIAGERRDNLEKSVAFFEKALQVWTLDNFPFYFAGTQDNLGWAYAMRIVGERRDNLERAIIRFQEALRVYTVEASPRETRNVYLHLAETEAQRENWDTVQDAYTAALEAEDLLVILGAGTHGRVAILKEGRDAAIRLGYALHRLGRTSEAAVAMERGRARGLAEAMTLGSADPSLITDEERRTRYTDARAALITAQADLHALSSQDLDEESRRRLDLEYTSAYRQARAAFDASVAEIRTAQDPTDFFNAPLDAATILRAAERHVKGHVLVYLAATPWGGVAIAALGAKLSNSSTAHFAALDLPDLTEKAVRSLIETRLSDGSERLIGGFVLAQMAEGFEQMHRHWEGETFEARINALSAACRQTGQISTLESAALEAMKRSPFALLAKQPLSSLSDEDLSLLSATLDQIFLQLELERSLDGLRKNALQPLVAWLLEQGVSTLTLIPCGHLAAFPLSAVILADGRSVAETLPTSVAPSARSLLYATGARGKQAGVYALGNPQNNLPWSEAEALTLRALARNSNLLAEVHIKQQATRERLLSALGSRFLVDASCHGTFDPLDFLRSALRLAKGERITMSEVLSHQVDLRGLRLLLLSACQTALLDLQGARDEVHSLAAAMLQAGAQAVLAAQWAVDDKATYLLIVRFLQEWFPKMEVESPTLALARAQIWLRNISNEELANWHNELPMPATSKQQISSAVELYPTEENSDRSKVTRWQRIPMRGRHIRYSEHEARLAVRIGAEEEVPSARPYADPYYWAGFQIVGW